MSTSQYKLWGHHGFVRDIVDELTAKISEDMQKFQSSISKEGIRDRDDRVKNKV